MGQYGFCDTFFYISPLWWEKMFYSI